MRGAERDGAVRDEADPRSPEAVAFEVRRDAEALLPVLFVVRFGDRAAMGWFDCSRRSASGQVTLGAARFG